MTWAYTGSIIISKCHLTSIGIPLWRYDNLILNNRLSFAGKTTSYNWNEPLESAIMACYHNTQSPANNIFNFIFLKEYLKESIGSDNGLRPHRQQSIMWTDDGLVCWHIYASLGLNKSMITCRDRFSLVTNWPVYHALLVQVEQSNSYLSCIKPENKNKFKLFIIFKHAHTHSWWKL